MSSWIKLDGGGILTEDGAIAIDESCCCGQFNCCCTRIAEMIPPPTFKAKIINSCSKMNGVEWDMIPDTTVGVCRRWTGTSAVVNADNCIWQIRAEMHCSLAPGEPSNWSDYQIYLQFTNDECAADNSQTDVYPYDGQCGETGIGTDKFFTRYTGFSMVNGIGPNCDCCEAFDIEVYEP